MNAKYFNIWELRKAFELSEIDPISSKVLYEEYLKKYPKDYSAYPLYASNLIILGELESAEKILNYVEKTYMEDESFKQFDKLKKFKQTLFFTKVKLLTYQGKNEELYKFCLNNINEIRDRMMNSVLFYAKKKTGRLNKEKRDANSYLYKQMVRYDENDFLEHIKKHLSDYNENINEPNTNVFKPNFPIKEVVEEVKKYIPSDKRLFLGFYDNVYVFKYNECGRYKNKLVNYFKVICLHDTNEIITMCPVIEGENLPHIDLNYLVKDDENIKIKRISQIDKFNQKYKRN